MNTNLITVGELQQALNSAHPPLVMDVRRAAVYVAATSVVVGASWQDPASVDSWRTTLSQAGPVVVYCAHGHEVSQNCASSLRAIGVKAQFLEGGIAAWALAGGTLQPKG